MSGEDHPRFVLTVESSEDNFELSLFNSVKKRRLDKSIGSCNITMSDDSLTIFVAGVDYLLWQSHHRSKFMFIIRVD